MGRGGHLVGLSEDGNKGAGLASREGGRENGGISTYWIKVVEKVNREKHPSKNRRIGKLGDEP